MQLETYHETPDHKVKLYCGHVLEVLGAMSPESVHCVVTSPPYCWSLRKYDCEPVIWGGDSGCGHEWDLGYVKGMTGGTNCKAIGGWAGGTTGQHTVFTGGSHATCRLCGAWRGQYGLEPTPALYVEHTMMWLDAVWQVLRKDGTVWLNLGDGYAGSWGNSGNRPELDGKGGTQRPKNAEYWARGAWDERRERPPSSYGMNGLKPKDAVLMPFRVALAAQERGWWVRSVIIWAKPNPMPESVRDRPTDAHEYIFLLTKNKTYWYDADAIREPLGEWSEKALVSDWNRRIYNDPPGQGRQGNIHGGGDGGYGNTLNPAGRNARSVWTFPTQPFPDAHFAVFPRELPERCVKAGCPEWVCPKCGKARVRVTESSGFPDPDDQGDDLASLRLTNNDADRRRVLSGKRHAEWKAAHPDEFLGWTDCGCGDFVGGVVLDPFAGSGTTCEVAYHLGRNAIGIDASAKYLDMAVERVQQGALSFLSG